MANYIQKFVFDKLPVKGTMVVLEDMEAALSRHEDYPHNLRKILGELLAANILLTSGLKLQGKIICQIQDSPYFDFIVTECSDTLNVRVTARSPNFVKMSELSYEDYLQGGRLVVSIDSQSDGQLYQSVIAFNGSSISEILNNYVAQSEQLQSWIFITYSKNRIVGLMLQQLPDIHGGFFQEIKRIFMLAATLTKRELMEDELRHIIMKLFYEDDVVIFDKQTVVFSCTCSRSRVGQILRNLGKDELQNIIREEGSISVNCEYCNTQYKFAQLELEQFVLQLSLEEMTPLSDQIN